MRLLLVVPGLACAVVACDRAESPIPAVPGSSWQSEASSAQIAAARAVYEEEIGSSAHPPRRSAPPEFDDADPSTIRLFYDVLAPYGTWTDDARLGLVWVPSADGVGSAFVPYGTHGRWTYRDVALRNASAYHDWVWVSDLPWGWVTFHYGRWAYTADRGWAWVAGRKYSGAWVDWRTPQGEGDGTIIGWGPTPPAHLWRVAPQSSFDPREALLTPQPYAAFATPYTYARTRDLFARELGTKLYAAGEALAVAHATAPGGAPSAAALGLTEAPAPPVMDRGLQQAWMLATPASASAVGAGPELGPPPRLRTWVAGGPRWSSH